MWHMWGGQEEHGIAEQWEGGSGNGAGPRGWASPGQGLCTVDLSPALFCSSTGVSLSSANQASNSYGEEFRPTSSQQEKHLVTDLLAHTVGDSLVCLHRGPAPWRCWNK